MGIAGIGNGGSWFQNWSIDKARPADGTATRLPASLKALGRELATGDPAAATGDIATITSASGRALNGRDATDFASQMSAIGSALDGGDVAGAKAAFQKMAQLVHGAGLHGRHHHHGQAQPATGATDSKGANANDPFAQAFGSLGAALDSGDLAGAQAAFSQLQSLLESAPDRKTALPVGMSSPADPAGGILDLQA